ncbi:SAV_915 family protein [Leucobacter albus]|uniref:SAV_915 family protein n=1 Tax=Leucobacter albus TaxID=272210 RepID=A0ABW3TTZ4_9MICO
MRGETSEGPIADVRELPDGRPALVAYTALDRLAEQCGENQPWMLVAIESLAEIKEQNKFDTVAFDPKFEAHLRENGRLL